MEQTSVLTGLRRFSVDNKVKYRGRLAAPYVSEPANMIVRFTLNPLTASFVVMDTDYTNYALVCTCQGKKFLFELKYNLLIFFFVSSITLRSFLTCFVLIRQILNT